MLLTLMRSFVSISFVLHIFIPTLQTSNQLSFLRRIYVNPCFGIKNMLEL